ncbi:hypothetical protein [Mongoliitalea daihaiensis]|uniref:hypothetical protein n=1 Tax=Mongoliitalea daihaiensis TaxID=2782006 RepID=UPI001F22A5B5|nr:hypothetical protein [Mongoliitalea daihaiensis]UJP64550.1 hypothetical protein IPZ59_17355 [Mongoliitalea daihaiensis]
MRYVLSLFILLISFETIAQSGVFPSQVWHKGQIVTTNGQVYQGQVKYDLENNLVQLQTNSIDTFGASNVSQFEIFDEQYGGIRTFYTLPFPLSGDYDTPVFFEILTEGDNIVLLCREHIVADNRGMGAWGGMPMNPMWGPQMGGAYKLAFSYYFIKDGKIIKYAQKKKELLDVLGDRSDEVELFMRKNRLSHDKRGDLLRITAYYNQIR